MSKINLAPDASGTGIFTIASPNSNTNRTLTLPDDTGTIVTDSGNQAGSFTTLNTSGAVVFNDAGADVDFRVEGDTDANLLFVDAGNDKFGVGTNAPFGKLDVRTTSAGSEAFAGVFANEGTTSGSKVSVSFVSGGDGVAGRIRSQIVGDSDGDNNGYLAFNTRNAGTQTERARITSGGYFKASNDGTYFGSAAAYHELRTTENTLCLLTTNTNASQTGNIVQIDVTRNTTNNSFYPLAYYNRTAAATRFQVADSGNVTNTNNSYGAISDVKLKQDIVDAGSQWDDIKGLRVRKFRWKSDPDGFMQMGLVAQEAEEVSPGLIDEHPDYEEIEVPVLDDDGNAVLNEDGTPQVTKERQATGEVTKSVKYSVLYMKAVKALQEAMERIETLEAKVAALEANNGV